MNEAVDCELEALQETFDVTVTSNDEACHSISMRLQPYTGDEDIFVETGLRFSLDRFYPRSMPKFLFDSHKGLSDERLQVLRKATAEAAQEFVGEPVLMTMCMAAKDALSLMNFPEGPCPFCLEPMRCAPACFCGPCFHGYHTECFRCWWLWLVQKHHDEEMDNERRRTSVGLGSVQKEKWDPRRSIDCPVCRVNVPHALLQHILSPDETRAGHPDPALHESWHKRGGAVVVTLPDEHDAVIDDILLNTVQRQQDKRMRIVEAQERCGGLAQKDKV